MRAKRVRPKRGGWVGYDADLLKGRLAEALIEGMLMRAGHVVSRSNRRGTTFVPGFMVRKAVALSESDRSPRELVPMEVIYRRDLRRFMRLEAAAFRPEASEWPGLLFVLVTDKPQRDRSCFQVLDLAAGLDAVHDVDKTVALDIYPSTAREYEQLAVKLFPLLERR